MTKIFISQPMSGLSEDEIKNKRAKITVYLKEKLGEDVEILDSYFEDFNPENGNVALKYLAMAIGVLADADVAYFTADWSESRGCKIERACAESYGIDIIEEIVEDEVNIF